MKNYEPYTGPPGTFDPYDTIEASNGTLMRQAQGTADTYMLAAVRDIDEILGKGYAAKHPELIAAYMQTAAIDLGSAIIARAIERVANNIDNAATTISESGGQQ